MFGVERTLLVFKFNLLPDIGKLEFILDLCQGQDLEIQQHASMNVTVDLDTDPT